MECQFLYFVMTVIISKYCVVEAQHSHTHNSQHCSEAIHPGQPITFLHACKKAARLANSLPEATAVQTVGLLWLMSARQELRFLPTKVWQVSRAVCRGGDPALRVLLGKVKLADFNKT